MSAAYRGENAEANAAAAWNRRAAPENKPLTQEELKQMDGEPVWVCIANSNIKCWAFVENFNENAFSLHLPLKKGGKKYGTI